MSIPSVAILLVQQIWNVPLPYHPGLILVVSWQKYAPIASFKPLYSFLKVELLQSDKQQPTIIDEPVVNTTTVSLPTDQPSSLVSTASTLDPIVSALQPLHCAMCEQLKSFHPSVCPSYDVSCSACSIVGRKLIFCRKVIALKKTT